MKSKTRLLLIGPIDGPSGGVNIHLKRLYNMIGDVFEVSFIDESNGHDKRYYHLRNGNLFKYFLLIYRADIIHIHSNKWWIRFLHFMLGSCFRSKIIITMHSWNKDLNPTSFKLTRYVLNHSNLPVFVNSEMLDLFKIKKGIVMNAFLPPGKDEIEKELPLKISNCLKNKGNNKIIVVSAYKLFYTTLGEVYGSDVLKELAKKIKETKTKIRIIFVISCPDENAYKYEETIRNDNLDDILNVYIGSISFSRLILEADFVLRPTLKDGDSIVVREGLYLRRKVIASDIIVRPRGVITFKTGDVEELFKKLTNNTISDVENYAIQMDYLNEYIKLYNEVL